VRGNRVLQIIEELEKSSPTMAKRINREKLSEIIDRILEIIREHKTFCIVGHVRPDGDCIGSQLGLALALLNEGKNSHSLESRFDSSEIQISQHRGR